MEGHMEVNVSQQLKASIGNVREYNVDEASDMLGQGVSTSVEGKVKFTHTNRGILVQGVLQTKVPVECSRCLKNFAHLLTINIEEEYFPIIDINTGIPVDIPDDPGGLTIDDHHILDLNEAIRQNALLAIPMKVLCRKDCRGLCQECGKNLNEGPCGCETAIIDPRWAQLAKLASTDNKSRKSKKYTE
jgi:uncharacterized protein